MRGPVNSDRIELGAKLFFDTRLSKDGTMSCATCHVPATAFTTDKPPTRVDKAPDVRLRRDIPSLLNVVFFEPLHRDGSEPSLETQVLAPLFNASEMANTTFEDLTSRLESIPEYRKAFYREFGGTLTIEAVGQVLAAYQRTLLAGGSQFDFWRLREFAPPPDTSIGADAEKGFELFQGKASCASCHAFDNGLFTLNEFLNTGVGFQSEARRAAETPNAPMDRGREEVTHKREDRYKFRTPTLRNVELTAPYMHDGSIKTLEDVVAYYNSGGSTDPEKDPRIKPLGLTGDEQRALVAFLKSLTSQSLPNMPNR